MSIPDEESHAHIALQESNRLIGFALNRVPFDDVLVAARSQPNRTMFGYSVADKVIERYTEEVGPLILPSSRYVISSGLRDTGYFIEGTLNSIPHALSFEQALSIFQQPTTVETLALLAMHDPYGRNNTSQLVNSPGESYRPAPDYSVVIPGEDVQAEYGGCPVAGDYETMKPKPTPLFRKFVAWSGELALRTFHYPNQ